MASMKSTSYILVLLLATVAVAAPFHSSFLDGGLVKSIFIRKAKAKSAATDVLEFTPSPDAETEDMNEESEEQTEEEMESDVKTNGKEKAEKGGEAKPDGKKKEKQGNSDEKPKPKEEASKKKETGPFPLLPESEAIKVVPKLLGKAWQRQTNYPISVSEAQGAIVKHKGKNVLIVAGGYLLYTNFDVTDHVYSFNVNDGEGTKWIRRANMPKKLTHVAQVAVGSKLYICGGFLGKHPGPSVRDCYVYDLAKDKWTELPPLPHRRAGGGIVYIKSRNALFFAGGTLRAAGSLHGVDHDDSYMLILNNLKKGWVKKASFQNPRNHMSAVTVGNRYFFVGGQHRGNEETGNQPTLNEYVPFEDKWYERAEMPYGIGHLSASTPTWGGGFLVIGGVKDGRKKSDALLFYDMLDDKWYHVGKYVIGIQTPVCGVVDDTIFCTTGAGTTNKFRWNETYHREIGHVKA